MSDLQGYAWVVAVSNACKPWGKAMNPMFTKTQKRIAFITVGTLALVGGAATAASAVNNGGFQAPQVVGSYPWYNPGPYLLAWINGRDIINGTITLDKLSPAAVAALKGADGKDGIDGTDGVSVTDAVVDADGHLQITLSNETTIDAGLVKGADGKDGADGATGAQGPKGDTGATGPGSNIVTTMIPVSVKGTGANGSSLDVVAYCGAAPDGSEAFAFNASGGAAIGKAGITVDTTGPKRGDFSDDEAATFGKPIAASVITPTAYIINGNISQASNFITTVSAPYSDVWQLRNSMGLDENPPDITGATYTQAWYLNLRNTTGDVADTEEVVLTCSFPVD